MTTEEIPAFTADFPNYGELARAWAERIPTAGEVSTADLLGPALRALTYAVLDAGRALSWTGEVLSSAIVDGE